MVLIVSPQMRYLVANLYFKKDEKRGKKLYPERVQIDGNLVQHHALNLGMQDVLRTP
jgi:hypothetical protein